MVLETLVERSLALLGPSHVHSPRAAEETLAFANSGSIGYGLRPKRLGNQQPHWQGPGA